MVKMSDVVIERFQDFWAIEKQGKYLKYVLKGGRGSAKSTHIGFKVLMDIMRYPITALCVKKVGNTLSESCYEQLKECAYILGVEHLFTFNISPLQIVYKPRGNKIIFRGGDDATKTKSLKIARFPVAILWIEELADFKTYDEVSTIEKTVLRAELKEGLRYKIFFSYNPPKRKQSWVNKYFETNFLAKNTYVHHSTYFDNPYISKDFKEEAEETKKRSQAIYDWEFMGKPIGSGVVPFDNLEFRLITDAEIAMFDNIRQGLDWGYATDPLAFVRMHYDKTRRTLYIYDEIYAVKMLNRELAEKIKAKGYDKEETIADGAEPKSVVDIREHGVDIKGAKKGPGSVEFGEKWLDDLDAIIIDPKRCPNTAREFENIDYQVDKDGNPKAKLEDKDNHTIDAVRYGMEDDMKVKAVVNTTVNRSQLGF